MLNDQGYVAECTGDNIFIVTKGTLLTPSISDGALGGITRGTVEEIAKQLNIPFSARQLTRYDVWNADECFLTGTAAEIIPVVEVDARVIGNGLPGEVTNRCLKAFREKASKIGRFL